MAGDDCVQSFGFNQGNCRLKSSQMRQRRRAAKLTRLMATLTADPVPIEAWPGVFSGPTHRALINRRKAKAWRHHQSLLRRTHRHVNAQLIHGKRCRRGRCDDVDDKERRMLGAVKRAADRSQIASDSAGSISVHDQHRADPMLLVIAQRLLDRSNVNRIAFDVRSALHGRTNRLGLHGPLIGEVATTRNQQGATGRCQVDCCCLPHAMAIGSVHDDVGSLGTQ